MLSVKYRKKKKHNNNKLDVNHHRSFFTVNRLKVLYINIYNFYKVITKLITNPVCSAIPFLLSHLDFSVYIDRLYSSSIFVNLFRFRI